MLCSYRYETRFGQLNFVADPQDKVIAKRFSVSF